MHIFYDLSMRTQLSNYTLTVCHFAAQNSAQQCNKSIVYAMDAAHKLTFDFQMPFLLVHAYFSISFIVYNKLTAHAKQ